MIGSSTKFKTVLKLIDKVAPTNARVLITGENGTEKKWLLSKFILRVLDAKT